MDQQPHGNFIAFINRSKQPGDNEPMFDGRRPRRRGREHRFAIWAHEYKNPATGEMQVMYNGQIDAVTAGAPVKDQVGAMMKAAGPDQAEATLGNLKLAPRELVLFPNRFKDDAPDKNRPDLWGAFYPAPLTALGAAPSSRDRAAKASRPSGLRSLTRSDYHVSYHQLSGVG